MCLKTSFYKLFINIWVGLVLGLKIGMFILSQSITGSLILEIIRYSYAPADFGLPGILPGGIATTVSLTLATVIAYNTTETLIPE